ncbi:exopolysaccharide biosynthesis protein [Salinarimonas ramus]|uniref:Sugar transporter n=1 Tax=Salinarimonas ramus TaxID=690164 RepID=A0A917Q6E7_9HYPH|nr:exopolysaccharide biosynthesis protein [Salinarimonas ramus]GGK22537.1 sugar transporter [Salinarimonas ramus]
MSHAESAHPGQTPPHEPQHEPASAILARVGETAPGERIPLGDLVDALGERTFGLVMLVLALPCAIPFLYGVPQIVSVPMVFVAAQLVIGRRALWLPQGLRARAFAKADYMAMIDRARPWLVRFEHLSRPRLGFLASGAAERVVGLAMLVASLSIAVPLPLTNTVPGIGVAIIAVGLIERDGLLVLGGALVALVWIGFLVFAGATVIDVVLGLFA